jgi:hypothetical protein
VPTAYEIAFRLPSFTRHISFADLHRLACYLVEDEGEDAHSEQVKSFSVRPLEQDAECWYFRLNVLDDELQLDDRITERLGRSPHLGRDLPLLEPAARAMRISYGDLANLAINTSAYIEFVSPTTFSRNGRSYALPDPMLIHRQLAKKWYSFAPHELEWSEDETNLLLSSVTLRSANINAAPIDGFGSRVGFVGTAEFLASREAARMLSVLWGFATYCGVGALTTQGLGAVRGQEI